MKIVGKTFGDTLIGESIIIDMVECEICGWRYKGMQECDNENCGKQEKTIWITTKT